MATSRTCDAMIRPIRLCRALGTLAIWLLLASNTARAEPRCADSELRPGERDWGSLVLPGLATGLGSSLAHGREGAHWVGDFGASIDFGHVPRATFPCLPSLISYDPGISTLHVFTGGAGLDGFVAPGGAFRTSLQLRAAFGAYRRWVGHFVKPTLSYRVVAAAGPGWGAADGLGWAFSLSGKAPPLERTLRADLLPHRGSTIFSVLVGVTWERVISP